MPKEVTIEEPEVNCEFPHTGLFVIARVLGDDTVEYFQKGAELIEFGPYDEHWSTDSGPCVPIANSRYLQKQIQCFLSVFKDMKIHLAEIMIYPQEKTDETTN